MVFSVTFQKGSPTICANGCSFFCFAVHFVQNDGFFSCSLFAFVPAVNIFCSITEEFKMKDFGAAFFPAVLGLLAFNALILLFGLVLHANGYFIKGHYFVAMSGLCGKWLVRNCPYEIGDKCPCWNCPRATDRKDPCPVILAQCAANRQKNAERKAARMARRKPQE